MGFKKILVPVDFSKESKAAVQYAVNLARPFHASIYLLHAVEPIHCAVDCGYGEVIRHIPDEDLGGRAKAKLRLLAKRTGGPCSSGKAILLNGSPEEMIIQAAKSLGADLIVMLTHDRFSPEYASRRSIAEHTIRNAPCPVLVVRK